MIDSTADHISSRASSRSLQGTVLLWRRSSRYVIDAIRSLLARTCTVSSPAVDALCGSLPCHLCWKISELPTSWLHENAIRARCHRSFRLACVDIDVALLEGQARCSSFQQCRTLA